MGLQIVKVIVHPKIVIVTVLTLMLFHTFLCGPKGDILTFKQHFKLQKVHKTTIKSIMK